MYNSIFLKLLLIYLICGLPSVRDVSCTYNPAHFNATFSNSNSSSNISLHDPCWDQVGLARTDVYKIFVAVFIGVLGPFAYFNVSKTKYLQIFTTLMRQSYYGIFRIVMELKGWPNGLFNCLWQIGMLILYLFFPGIYISHQFEVS